LILPLVVPRVVEFLPRVVEFLLPVFLPLRVVVFMLPVFLLPVFLQLVFDQQGHQYLIMDPLQTNNVCQMHFYAFLIFFLFRFR
jgi:hypothetical protein